MISSEGILYISFPVFLEMHCLEVITAYKRKKEGNTDDHVSTFLLY